MSSAKSISQPNICASASADLIVRPRGRDGLEQRAVDDAPNRDHAAFQGVLQHVGLEAGWIVAADLKGFARAYAALEADEPAVALGEVQRFARLQGIEHVLKTRQRAQRSQIRKVEL